MPSRSKYSKYGTFTFEKEYIQNYSPIMGKCENMEGV